MLKTEPIEFAEILVMGCVRERRCQDFGPGSPEGWSCHPMTWETGRGNIRRMLRSSVLDNLDCEMPGTSSLSEDSERTPGRKMLSLENVSVRRYFNR